MIEIEGLYGYGILVFTSFFTLINPIGSMPVFLGMTNTLTEVQRRKTAWKAVVVAFFTLIMFAFSGQVLFQFFGISVNSFRIVGGIIFFIMGQDMLHARLGKMKFNDESEVNNYVSDISITPLAIPMIAGPGAITNSIVLMDDAGTLDKKITLIVVMALVMLLSFVVFMSATKISNFLGETGNRVLMKLMGLIVMVIAVEFFFSGLTPILQNILKL
ncbi:MAG: multiple antibiotic resistance protein [Salibacteraceae bacterium]|jgi:multiple antibiotic resistance protein